MKFYEFILKLQELNPGKIVMVRSGTFFNSVGKDAIVLEYLLGFKRTCFAKGLCKVGMPVTYVKENMEVVKKRLKSKNISIIIYDEMKGGKYKFKNKETNTYTIERENFEKLNKETREFLKRLLNIK